MPTTFRFRDAEIDPEQSCVRRGGEVQYLRPKTFHVLMHLIANPGRDVTKEEILQAVWRGTAVTDDTLVQSIVDIRKAVGDDPRAPWFIRTIPRVGYRLIAQVEAPLVPAESVAGDEIEESERVSPAPVPNATWRFLPAAAIVTLLLLFSSVVVIGRRPSREGAKPVQHRAIDRPRPASRDHLTDNAEAYEAYTRGMKAADELEINVAVADLDHAIALDPGFAMAYARIGYAYAVRSSQHEEAKPYLARALAHGERLSEQERLYVLAWQDIANHDYGKGIDHYRVLVSRYPTDTEAFEELGRLLVGEERLEEAIEVFRRGLVVDPGSAHLNNAIGTALSYLGRHEEAIAYHKRYVSLDPSSPNAHDSLGLSYQWSGDFGHALAEYDQALRLNPRFEVALVHRANTYWQTGRVREAIRGYQQYVEIAPSTRERARGWGELSNLYRGIGDWNRAIPAARNARKLDVDSVISQILLAVDQGDGAEARRLVDSLPSPVSGNRGARYSVRVQYVTQAEVARVNGDAERAIEYAREAVRRLPTPYLIDDHEDILADTLAAFGRYQEAIGEYRRVLGINPHRGRTRYKLARALDAAGKPHDARREYERFLAEWPRADPDVPEVVGARSRLGRP